MLKIIDKENDNVIYVNTANITRIDLTESHKQHTAWIEEYSFKLIHNLECFLEICFDDKEFGKLVSQKLIEEIIANFEGCKVVDRKIKLEGIVKNTLADICSVTFNLTPSKKEGYEFGIINYVDHFDNTHFTLENYRKLIDSLEKNVKHVIDLSKIVEEV